MASEGFYILDCVFYALFFIGLLYRWWQTRVIFYALFAIPILMFFLIDVFIVTHAFGDSTLSIILIIGQTASLLVAVTTLLMLRTWIESMSQPKEQQQGYHMNHKLLKTCYWICQLLLIAFAVFSILGFVLFILRVTTKLDSVYTYISGFGFVLCALIMLAITVVLFIKMPTGTAGYATKRGQMARLVGYSLLLAIPVIVYSTADYFIASIVFWAFVILTLYPDALINYDKNPEQAHPFYEPPQQEEQKAVALDGTTTQPLDSNV
jgi:hypothetical protein